MFGSTFDHIKTNISSSMGVNVMVSDPVGTYGASGVYYPYGDFILISEGCVRADASSMKMEEEVFAPIVLLHELGHAIQRARGEISPQKLINATSVDIYEVEFDAWEKAWNDIVIPNALAVNRSDFDSVRTACLFTYLGGILEDIMGGLMESSHSDVDTLMGNPYYSTGSK